MPLVSTIVRCCVHIVRLVCGRTEGRKDKPSTVTLRRMRRGLIMYKQEVCIMALVCYSHLPCRICSQIVRMYKSVAIQYNHHGVVCQLLQQYRACVVDSVLWYIVATADTLHHDDYTTTLSLPHKPYIVATADTLHHDEWLQTYTYYIHRQARLPLHDHQHTTYSHVYTISYV